MIKTYLIGLAVTTALSTVGWAIQNRSALSGPILPWRRARQEARQEREQSFLAVPDEESKGAPDLADLALEDKPPEPDDANVVAVGPELRSGAYYECPDRSRYRSQVGFWGRGPVRRALRWVFCPRFRRGCW